MLLMQVASAIALVLMSSVAMAQQPNPLHLRGIIESKDHQTLDVKARDGETLKVKLADNAPVRAVVKASLSDIKPSSFAARWHPEGGGNPYFSRGNAQDR
jgi:hypothetical protein